MMKNDSQLRIPVTKKVFRMPMELASSPPKNGPIAALRIVHDWRVPIMDGTFSLGESCVTRATETLLNPPSNPSSRRNRNKCQTVCEKPIRNQQIAFTAEIGRAHV